MNYQEFVKSIKKDPAKIDLSDRQCDLIHMAMGIAGEAGELLDAIKKHTIYDKPIDIKNVIEELGDLEFYMEGMRQILHLTRCEIIEANVDKLKVRYHKGTYSDDQAQQRADKE